MNFCLPVGLISSSNGLFPEVDFKLLEPLRAGSSSDVAETGLSTKFIYIYILHLKQLIKKCHVFWTHIKTHILSKTVTLIVLARSFEIYFERAKSMQMHVHMLKKEFKNITFVYELRNAVKILNMLLIIKNKFSTFLLSLLFDWYMS